MMIWKKMVLITAACAAAALSAMPTAKEISAARSLVSELMAPEMKALQARTKTAAEVGDAACTLAKEAAGEGAKWLLLSGAATYYAKDGREEQILATLNVLQQSVKDIPDADLADLLADVLKAWPKGRPAPAALTAAETELDGRVRATETLRKTRAALKKAPKDPALHHRAGVCLAVLDDWDEALKEFAQADEKTVAAAKGEQRKSWPPEKLADFWWNKAAQARGLGRAAYLRHASALYAAAVASGALVGLEKTRAERRIAEAGSADSAQAQTVIGKTVSGDSASLYLVIDLSAGPKADRYPVSYLKDVPKGGWTDEYKTTKLVLRRIEPGSYIMGDDQKDESHRVTITKPFYIGVFEVTQRQWKSVMGENRSLFKGDDRPVERASWIACQKFVKKCQAGGVKVRLPTGREWEYACRAGSTGDWGRRANGEEGPLGTMGWYKDNSGNRTHSVAQKEPNAWGLYDMHGNVWEWCEDAVGSHRVRRGGCWHDNSRNCTAGDWERRDLGFWDSNLGFRLAGSQD